MPPSSGKHAAPVWANDSPPFFANTKSTAYSGSTAIRARIAIARPAEMSSCAASAAHESMKAAPTMARPKRNASSGWEMSGCVNRTTKPGTVRAAAAAISILARVGCTPASS